MGEVFAGRYELIDLVGEGGMGSVWRVWDAREERIVAAKVLRQSDAVSLLRFVREQAVRVQHPHVLTPLGWAGEDDRVLFTMPVVAGGSVATLIGDHGALPPRYAAEVMRQLLAALDAVHGAGVLHRDVKPANLLLAATGTERPHLLLTDFGIAIDLDGPRLTRTGVVTGTPGYLAPETLLGAGPDVRADLYAAGQVLRAMLSGEPAGAAESTPPGVPQRLWDLATALTAQDPDDRPGTAADAARGLAAVGLPWVSGAAEEVEVLRQVPSPPVGVAQLEATATPEEDRDCEADEPTRAIVRPVAEPVAVPVAVPMGTPGQVEPASTPRDPGSAAGGPAAGGPATARTGRSAAATVAAVPVRTMAAAVAALGIAGVLLLWSPWDGSGGADPSPSRSTAPATGSSTSPQNGAGSGSPTSAGSPTSTSGTVRVGTVVARAGQPCEFSDVGVRDTTVDGVAVVCTREPSGAYAWLKAAS